MQLTIESTPTVTTIDGVPVRLWKGTTAGGAACDVYVHRIATDDERAAAEIERELHSTPKPDELRRLDTLLGRAAL